MLKDIIPEDFIKIKELACKVLNYKDDNLLIERLGGLTNHSYKVTLNNNKIYVFRIPGKGTENMINRHDEYVSTKLAYELDIDAPLIYFGEDGTKISEYINNSITMNSLLLRTDEHITSAANILRRLHNSKINTGIYFNVFDIAKNYENIINTNNVSIFEDYTKIKEKVIQIKDEIDIMCSPQLVPCHNDPLCENWILGKKKLYLIDWEYAGMNDGLWDLAAVSIEADFSEHHDELFLKTYYNNNSITFEIKKHFLANKIYVDYLWTLWAKTRVPFDGKPMEDWANQRYSRLKSNIKIYENL